MPKKERHKKNSKEKEGQDNIKIEVVRTHEGNKVNRALEVHKGKGSDKDSNSKVKEDKESTGDQEDRKLHVANKAQEINNQEKKLEK